MDAEYRDSSPQIPIEGDGSTSEAPSSVSRDNASNGVEKMKEHSNEASARKRRRVKEELDDPAETTEEDCLRAEVRRLRARIQAIEKEKDDVAKQQAQLLGDRERELDSAVKARQGATAENRQLREELQGARSEHLQSHGLLQYLKETVERLQNEALANLRTQVTLERHNDELVKEVDRLRAAHAQHAQDEPAAVLRQGPAQLVSTSTARPHGNQDLNDGHPHITDSTNAMNANTAPLQLNHGLPFPLAPTATMTEGAGLHTDMRSTIEGIRVRLVKEIAEDGRRVLCETTELPPKVRAAVAKELKEANIRFAVGTWRIAKGLKLASKCVAVGVRRTEANWVGGYEVKLACRRCANQRTACMALEEDGTVSVLPLPREVRAAAQPGEDDFYILKGKPQRMRGPWEDAGRD